MTHTLVEIYLISNVFLTGTLWHEIKIEDYGWKDIISFVARFLFLIFLALPIFIISDILDFVQHKKENSGIDVTNFLYLIEKKYMQLIKWIKEHTK